MVSGRDHNAGRPPHPDILPPAAAAQHGGVHVPHSGAAPRSAFTSAARPGLGAARQVQAEQAQRGHSLGMMIVDISLVTSWLKDTDTAACRTLPSASSLRRHKGDAPATCHATRTLYLPRLPPSRGSAGGRRAGPHARRHSLGRGSACRASPAHLRRAPAGIAASSWSLTGTSWTLSAAKDRRWAVL